MKKLKRVLLFLLILFLLPLGVKAETVITTLSGGTTVAGGDKIDFTIGIKSDTNATSFEAAIRYDTNVLEFIGIGKEDNWQGNNKVRSTGNNTLKFTNAGVTGESSVATLKFRVKTSNKTSTTVTLDGIKVTLNTKTGEAIGGAFKKAINSVIATVEKGINFIPNAVNKMVGKINQLPGVSISPIQTVSLPRLAKGGVVKRATTAMIGEDGAEAVIPLERNRKWIREVAKEFLAQQKQGENVVINQTNNYSQAHSRYELWRSEKATVSAVKLALKGV